MREPSVCVAPKAASYKNFGESANVGRRQCNLLLKLPHLTGTQCISTLVPFRLPCIDGWAESGEKPTCQNSAFLLKSSTQKGNASAAAVHCSGSPDCPLQASHEDDTCYPDADFLYSLVRKRFGIPPDQQRLLVNGRVIERCSCLKNGSRSTILKPVPLEQDDDEDCLVRNSDTKGMETNGAPIHGFRNGRTASVLLDSCSCSSRQPTTWPLKRRDVSACSNNVERRLEQMAPPFLNVTVLLRLRGGKGGFGANLRAVKGRRKKTTNNLDACRDLSGRRLRHAQAVERVKEWLVKKRQEDELVKRLTDGAEQLSISEQESDPSVSLDKGYVKQIRSRAARLTRTVREGMREDNKRQEHLNAEEARARESSASTRKVLASKSWYLHNAAFSDEDADSDEELTHEEDVQAKVPEPVAPRKPRFLKTIGNTFAAKSPSLERRKPVVKQSSGDQKPQSSSSFVSTASTSGTRRAQSQDHESSSRGEPEIATATESPSTFKAEENRRNVVPGPNVEEETRIEKEAGELDLSAFSSAEELEKVDPEVLKAKLRSLGMKCGGRPSERAARLFLLKSRNIEELPTNVFAKPTAARGS